MDFWGKLIVGGRERYLEQRTASFGVLIVKKFESLELIKAFEIEALDLTRFIFSVRKIYYTIWCERLKSVNSILNFS